MHTFWVFHTGDPAQGGCAVAIPAMYMISSILVGAFLYYCVRLMFTFEGVSSFDGEAKVLAPWAFAAQFTYAMVFLTCQRGEDRPTWVAAADNCVQKGYNNWSFVLAFFLLVLMGIIRAADPTSVSYSVSKRQREEWRHNLVAREQARRVGKHFDGAHNSMAFATADKHTKDENGARDNFSPATGISGELDRQQARQQHIADLVDRVDQAEAQSAEAGDQDSPPVDGNTANTTAAAAKPYKFQPGKSLRRFFPIMREAFQRTPLAKFGVVCMIGIEFIWLLACWGELSGSGLH